MIHDRIVAARYAEAFLKHAQGTISRDQALLAVMKVRGIMRDNPRFKELLEFPGIGFSDKCRIVDEVLPGTAEPVRDFLKLLIDKNRIANFWDIVEYLRLKYAHVKETEVLLKTTFPVDVALLAKIKATLEKKIKNTIKLYIELDSRLLGGIQVIIGNKIIDGSVNRRLEDLRQRLLSVSLE